MKVFVNSCMHNSYWKTLSHLELCINKNNNIHESEAESTVHMDKRTLINKKWLYIRYYRILHHNKNLIYYSNKKLKTYLKWTKLLFWIKQRDAFLFVLELIFPKIVHYITTNLLFHNNEWVNFLQSSIFGILTICNFVDKLFNFLFRT